MFSADELDEDEISWSFMLEEYEPLPTVLVSMIAGYICPNRRSRCFPFGWGQTLHSMLEDGTCYAWGVCLLAHLYHDLHDVAYQEGASLLATVTLLHVWTWEHIAITHPNHMRFCGAR